MEPKVVHRDPLDLMLHRLLKRLPDPDKKTPEWAAFVNNVRARGVVEPLLITPDNLVMGGGRRWHAARQIELDEIPCLVRPENEAGTIVVESLLHCRHMTRGAAVYLALTMLQDFIESAESRRLANLRRGVKTNEKPLIFPKDSTLSIGGASETVQELCDRWGVAVSTYKQARDVQEVFAKRPELKKQLEPQLLSGEKNLWNILSAVGGSDTDQSQRGYGVVAAAFRSFKKSGDLWKKLSREERTAVIKKWREDVAELPGDMREAIAEVLTEEVPA